MVKINTQIKTVFYSRNGSKISFSTARKEHGCKNCGKIIKKGEKQKTITFHRRRGYYSIHICKYCW